MNTDILSNLIITKVYHASTMYNLETKKKTRKDRPRWAVIIKSEGETVYTSKGKRFVSDINHIVLLPKGCSYTWECTKAGHFSVVEFECEPSFCEPVSFPVKNGEKILRLIKDLEFKRTLQKPMLEAESIRDVYSILIKLAEADEEKYVPGDKRKKLFSAIEYISQNYNNNITNDTLAEVSGMSVVYFRKLFTSLMGISPIAYARQLRIEKAKELLSSDYASLTDIANFLGYSSLYDFSRDFKKHTGVAPSKY